MAGPLAGRPLPLLDEVSTPFWEGCARGELLAQHCAHCGLRRFPPRPMCPRCHSMESRWLPLPTRGRVYSFVICHPPVLPAFRKDVPYVVAVVELPGEPPLRMVGNVLECPPEQVHIGMPVAACFQPVGEGVHLPQWRPAEALGRPGERG